MKILASLIRNNTQIKKQIKLLNIQLICNENKIEAIKQKQRQKYDPLYFIKNPPNNKQTFLL